MKYKKGCTPQKLFEFPETAIDWAQANHIQAERSMMLEMFVVNPTCYVDAVIGDYKLTVCYKVIDVSDKYPEGRLSGTSIAKAEFYSVVIYPKHTREHGIAFQ